MGRGIGIFELVSDAHDMSDESFEAKHGSYFLIRTLDDGSLEPLAGFSQQTTAVIEPGDLEQQRARLDNPEASYVYPVRPARLGQAVVVGRASTSDVCIDDRSLSKKHAELFVRSDGSLAIIDRESRNGTFLGPQRIESGVPTVAQFGKTITFGGVRLSYLPVRQLVDFIRVTFDHVDWGHVSERATTVADPAPPSTDESDDGFDIDVEFDDG